MESIVETLCANMLSDTEQLRDISSIGLKTVISELPLGSNTLAANVCKKITGRLSSAIEKVKLVYNVIATAVPLLYVSNAIKLLSFQQEDVSVQLEALDILADLLSRFGGLLISFHPLLLNSLLPQLASPRQVCYKQTTLTYNLLNKGCYHGATDYVKL